MIERKEGEPEKDYLKRLKKSEYDRKRYSDPEIKAKTRERSLKWARSHVVENRAKVSEWGKSHPDKVNEHSRKWAMSNRERRKEMNRSWYERNKGKSFEKSYKWAKDHPDRTSNIQRRSRKKAKARYSRVSSGNDLVCCARARLSRDIDTMSAMFAKMGIGKLA